MVTTAEFEEKTYEKFFGQEIARWAQSTYSPGQCGEQYLGFDDAFFLPWFVRRRFLWPDGRWWAHRPGFAIGEVEEIAQRLADRLPEYHLNLFVQYKRPEWVQGHRGGEWHHWRRPYYRYRITSHQQNALERIARIAGDRAAVIYAAPALWRATDLFKAHEKRQVVESSNIAAAARMTGHETYSYTLSGTKGWGHSEPEYIDGPTLERILKIGFEQPGLRFDKHIKQVAQQVEEAAQEPKGFADQIAAARRAILSLNGYGEVPSDTFLYGLATLDALQDVVGLRLFALGGKISTPSESAAVG